MSVYGDFQEHYHRICRNKKKVIPSHRNLKGLTPLRLCMNINYRHMKNKGNNYAIIMAGGVGSRFWPWSRNSRPKQFLDILGTGKSMLEQTFSRLEPIFPVEHLFIVTNEQYREEISRMLPALPPGNILTEPFMRNTAPCIAYGAYKIQKKNPLARILVAPSDHLILKESVFHHAIEGGLAYASNRNTLLTIGIEPHRPETGYGYIKAIEKETLKKTPHFSLHPVERFTEKPDLNKAKSFLKEGSYYWNSGMFIWTVSSILKAFDAWLPEINQLFINHLDQIDTPAEPQAIRDIYKQCPSVSIDYGIMEKADNVSVLCTDPGWSDVGTWGSLFEHSPRDDNNNAVRAEQVILDDNRNCIIRIPGDKAAVIQGLEDYIVVDEDNALLICKKEDEQKIRDYVKRVKDEMGPQFI